MTVDLSRLDVPLPVVEAEAWNLAHPVGTPVVAYPGCRPEFAADAPRIVTSTRSKATVLGGHTAVVWVHGHSACIALSHVDVRTAATPGELAEMRHLLLIADADDVTRPFVDLRKGRKTSELAAREADNRRAREAKS
ncbi:hypothetical protein AB0D42_27730 [Streptomyces sp. NPDC048304]|uniref:hypothetical protein n=1 Tax=Streptomyces sp. NPDC048304 TaxID=3154820 RepID=UPI0033FAFDE6